MFAKIDVNSELRQSEIITGLKQYIFSSETKDVIGIAHPYSIILSQDCDLLWAFQARINGQAAKINGVLLYVLDSEENTRSSLAGGDIWKRVKKNQDERYHILSEVPMDLDAMGHGLPQLIVDFKRFYTMDLDELHRQCAADGDSGGAKRRCRLDAPYREHLQNRAGAYFQRVALPDETV